MILGLPSTLYGLLHTLLWTSPPTTPGAGSHLTFHLRHQHAVANDSRVIFSDIVPETFSFSEESLFTVPTQGRRIPRPESLQHFHSARLNRDLGATANVKWQDWDIVAPDITKRSTLLMMGKMAFNTYAADNKTAGEWYDLSGEWKSDPFGWLPEDDGMRGHIFVSEDNSTVVIGIKGTSAGWLVGGGGPTVGRDKKNDNILFSCCCARVGPTWTPVCGCYEGNYRCEADCVEEALKEEGLFYPLGLDLYNNVTYMYPDANIWLTGHSLGGGLASLMGATFGAPVVAFESPAERLASQRLHLPRPPSMDHIVHVYNTADPIPMGTCTGVTSLCAIGGFALETRCHQGQVILYDTVQKLGWSVDVRNHGIKLVVDRLLSDNRDWKDEFNGEKEEQDEKKGLFSAFRWGWGRRGGEQDEEDNTKYREVPLPRKAHEVEGVDGVCTVCILTLV
ncbi:alpha/beta-hydrolase [Agrocybe pediades]|nr:alpha/beta-hydrolase [Agrocybe pediades]